MFSTPIILLFASVIHYASSEKYAYVKSKIPVVECTEIPNDGVCPRDHKIPDFSKIPGDDGKPLDSFKYNKTFINQTLNLVFTGFGANETCKKSYRAYFCSVALPVCEDDSDFYYINGEKTLESCEQAKKDCSALPSIFLNSAINCSMIDRLKVPKRNLSCEAYPDIKNDPYPCSKRDIMGPASFMSHERNNAVLDSHNMLKKYESKLDKKCVDDVAKVICDAASPACTRDEKYIVDLVSKQDCQKIMGCLSEIKDANFTKGALGICDHLADATTAKKIPLSDVYSTDDATTKGASIATMFFAFLYFMQHLHYV